MGENMIHPLLLPCSLRLFVWASAAPSSPVHSHPANAEPEWTRPQIHLAQVPIYLPTERDPFLNPEASPQAPSQSGVEDLKSHPLDSMAREIEEFARQWLPVRGVICSPAGSSALVGRKIVKPGGALEIVLDGELEKRIPTQWVRHRGAPGQAKSGVLQSRVEGIEPNAVRLSVDGLSTPLMLPFTMAGRRSGESAPSTH